ncbi:dihydroxyacetone kinase subunit DhaL [Streptomyces sp. NPDC057702]|uniref:dihydroxyacetone kinase subunit DhaL n=1 Tax=unclassified Streptomyces TaxID=2593676 RepID=UPI00368BB9B5
MSGSASASNSDPTASRADPAPGSGVDAAAGLDAAFFVRWLAAVDTAVAREADRLTELDAAIGDADHGSNLRRGFAAVTAALDADPPATPGAVLALAGRQLISTVGGASGPLYGTLLRRTGKELGDARQVSAVRLGVALRAGVAAVAQLGGAAPGDKTMLDALGPGADALGAGDADDATASAPAGAGGGDAELFAVASAAAEEGARATVELRARKGRASYLGERSVGHLDPGAASSVLLFAALAEVAR